MPLGLQEGVCHAATDNQGGGVLQQAFQHGNLGGNLGSTNDGHHGLWRIGNHGLQILHLLLHQKAANLHVHELGDSGGGGMGTVGGTEGIVHVHVAVGGQLLGQLLLLLSVL